MKVLVLGASGQDGSYACENLITRGFKVYAGLRKSATTNKSNLVNILKSNSENLELVRFDLGDESSIYNLVSSLKPDFLFNYADQDHVSWSHSLPLYSCDITSKAVNTIAEAIKLLSKKTVLIQPISSNIFGNSEEISISEDSQISPLSPYAIAKATALFICRYYKQAHGLKILNPILFNHESERRTDEYVTRKISSIAAKIKMGYTDKITLGDISAEIDWGYAPEYVNLMIDLALKGHFDEFVIGTGKLYSVKDFANACFKRLDLDFSKYLKVDEKLMRPTKNKPLKANIKKVNNVVGYEPNIYGNLLAQKMVDNDYKILQK